MLYLVSVTNIHKLMRKTERIIEKTVCKNILDITNRIVLDVGDGTTSAVILSSLIFKIAKFNNKCCKCEY